MILKVIQQTQEFYTQELPVVVFGDLVMEVPSSTPIFDKHVQSIGVVSLDPTNPDQNIWVGTGETWTRNSVSIGDGLFKSTDGGSNFKEVPGFENSERITSIVINPENNQEIYVGVLGSALVRQPR